MDTKLAEQHLAVLDKASSLANGTRADHVKVQEAIAFFVAYIESQKPKEKTE